MSRRFWRPAIVGVLLGSAVALGAREVILKPVRERREWLHTDEYCGFRSEIWKAEAGVDWQSLEPHHRGARARMEVDLIRFHLGRGTSKATVRSLLGVPDRVEGGSVWVYRVSETERAIVSFNPWGVVHSVLHRFECPLVLPPRNHALQGRGSLATGRLTMK
jgi:hypothetical protein